MHTNKHSKTSFASIDEFYTFGSEFREVALSVRHLIFDTVPKCTEKLSWGIPMYSLKKYFCYLNYRKNIEHTDKSLDTQETLLFLGFTYGYRMFDSNKIFEPTKHSQIKYVRLNSDTDFEVIKDYLLQAVEIDGL